MDLKEAERSKRVIRVCCRVCCRVCWLYRWRYRWLGWSREQNFRDLDHKNLFYGVEKELEKVYKKVEIDMKIYTFKKKQYNLEVLYYDEDHVD